MTPKVSICLPNLNTRRFLEPRMESIFSQTLTDWELIVCDSYSDDGAWEYFQTFAGDARVRLYQVPRAGVYAGWNECLRRVTGEYVYIATSDDTMTPDCLEKMCAALEKADCRLQTTDCRQKTEDGRQKTEDGRRKTEDGRRKTEDGRRKTEDGRRKTEDGRRKTEDGRLHSHTRALPADIAVCNFDYIDEQGNVIRPRSLCDIGTETEKDIPGLWSNVYGLSAVALAKEGLKSLPSPLPPAGAFYGDDRYRAHRRSGYIEFLTHLLIGTSWTTMTAVLYRSRLLAKTGLYRTDVPLADRLWAYRSAVHSDTIVVPETLATWRQHSTQDTAVGRRMTALDAHRYRRRIWRGIVATVRECEPLLPRTWRERPGFLEAVLWAERRHYLDHYALSRTHLRHYPARFLRGALCAALLEPRYLWERLRSGLAWPEDHDLSEADYLRNLLKSLRIDGNE